MPTKFVLILFSTKYRGVLKRVENFRPQLKRIFLVEAENKQLKPEKIPQLLTCWGLRLLLDTEPAKAWIQKENKDMPPDFDFE